MVRITCDFKFCRFCGHGDECSANGHQQSQCKYKQLQEVNKITHDEVARRFQVTDEPWTTLNVGGEVDFRPQFLYARPDTNYGVTTNTADIATRIARNLERGF